MERKYNLPSSQNMERMYGQGENIEEIVEEIHQFGRSLTTGPDAREKSLRFLQDARIIGKDGKLTKPYRGTKT